MNIILDIGCGENVRSEATHALDFRRINVPDNVVFIEHDLNVLPLPFADNSVYEAFLCHVLEHFPRETALELLIDIHRILMPHGILHVHVPNAYMTMKFVIDSGSDDLEMQMPAWGKAASVLWSTRIYKGSVHQYGYSGTTFERILNEAGFEIVWRNAYDWALIVDARLVKVSL